jgi:hypothetical protein
VFLSFGPVSTFTVVRVSIARRVLETCCIISILVWDHHLREV